MTNWETFIVVAITLVLILGPFAAMIIAGLRHSKETYQVLYKAESFNNPWPQYFISLDIFFASFFTILSGLIFSLTFDLKIGPSSIPDWCVYALLYTIVLMILSLSGYIFSLTINYWEYTKDVILTFDPKTKTIFVRTASCEYVLHEDDMKEAEIFTNDNYKLPFLYYRFRLQNGEELLLTGHTKGVLGIFEYFKKIPQNYHKQFFPIIT